MKIIYTTVNIFFALILISNFADASTTDEISCYQIPVTQSPDGISQAEDLGTEVWCYTKINQEELLIFNYDQQQLKPELSLLIEQSKTIATGVLSQGKIAYVKSDYTGLLPFNVPLDLNKAMKQHQQKTVFTSSNLQRINKMATALKAAPFVKKNYESNTRNEESAYLDSSKFPYSGYWWSHSDQQLFHGSNSPLGKYDAAYLARNGSNPQASYWESKNHSLTSVPWGGHCNGWAASSILYPEWNERLYDPLTKQIIIPTDVQGILAEGSFCVYWAFYGKRYNAQPGDDITDIHPDLFHKVLRYYLSIQKKPIAMDYFPGESIDNNVITGYSSELSPIPDRPNWYLVKTVLQMHDYDHTRNERPGPADIYDSEYEYRLELDSNGTPINGEWISENPDFLWVPLAQKDCGRENPNIDLDFVFNWLNSLPKAIKKTIPLNIAIKQLNPGESKVLLNSTSSLVGAEFSFHFNEFFYDLNNLGGSISADSAIYPSTNYPDAISGNYYLGYLNHDYDYEVSAFENSNFRLKVLDLNKFNILNQTDHSIIFPNNFMIESLEYWAPPN